jgi:beta-mannosidase
MKTIDLAGDWRLVRVATGRSCPAHVPGDTHSALLAAGEISDPYVGTNELAVQWVGREDWEYRREFAVSPDFLAEEEIWLSCDCLDTIAEISINGKAVGRADNAFVRWRFDVKRHLRAGKNTIRILFRSAEKAAETEAKRLPYPIPHSLYPVQSPHRNLIRKVQCHSGWDWGPCLMVAGIQGDISLGATSTVRIDYVYTEQRHSKGACGVRVFAECTAARAGAYEIAATLGGKTTRKTVSLAKGFNRPQLDLVVENPRVWWPNGYGEQPLYDLAVEIGGHQVSKRIGLRTVELVNREDMVGLSMSFRVNGVSIFCKGANWIPCDALPQRQSRARLEALLSSAAAAHMNMLRAWGGGRYESDDFYDLCDEKGIMVWQDMMFSCALYPSTLAFLASVEREVRHQARRLRDHPSLALWCGNNEDLGALTWFPESRANRDRYVVDYDRLNEGVIGRALDECDPTRPFWPSSPSGGRGDYSDNWHDDSRGDMHYWSVWHEGKPFSAYQEVTPRFCSEFGYQSFPSMEAIRAYADPASLNPTAPVMEHHQRHPRGNSIITEMFTRYFRVPEGFESFVYLSQVQQALAIRTAIEWWRHLRPTCMGTLYWQLDDTWPVCSWSSIEYSGKWKLLHYAARRFYAPVLLAGFVVGDSVEIWAVNDRREPAVGRVQAAVMDFAGKIIRKESFPMGVPAGSARMLRKRRLASLTPVPERSFLLLTMEMEDETVTSELFFTEYKRCDLAPANVRAEVIAHAGGRGITVSLTTDAPAFFVSLDAEGIPGEFADNCFTLVPGTPRLIGFIPGVHGSEARPTLAQFRKALSIRHLRDTYR